MATLTVDNQNLKIGNRYFFTLNGSNNTVAKATLIQIIPANNGTPVQYVFSNYQVKNITVPGTVTIPENVVNMFYVFAPNGFRRLPPEILSKISKYGGVKKTRRLTKKRH